MQYGKLVEFVTMVTEMVPELLSSRQRAQLILGLRAKLVLELCRSESTADHQTIQTHLDIIHNLTEKSSDNECHGDELEASDSNFVELVKTLLKDTFERENFFQEVFPIHYGLQYDTALQRLMSEFLSRLEELLPVPDLAQTTEWLDAAPSVLEECEHTVIDPEQLKTVLQHHQHKANMSNSLVCSYTADTILSTLTLPPRIRVVNEPANSNSVRPDIDSAHNGTGGCEEEEENDTLDKSTNVSSEHLSLFISEQQKEEGLLPAECLALGTSEPCDELKVDHFLTVVVKGDKPSQALTCTLRPFSHGEMADIDKDVKMNQVEKASKQKERKRKLFRKGDKKRVVWGNKKKATKICDKKKEGSPTPQNKTYTCTCGKVFKKPSLLTLHMGVHTMPYLCDQCPKRYATPGALKKHQVIHTEVWFKKPFKCERCDRRYRSEYDLKKHVRSHSGERRHVCTICEKRFTQQCTLVRHRRMHAGEKNYSCSVCGKAFLSNGELRLHTRTHTGENPHTCKQCGKGFKASCHLTVHLRSHTGERPYSCTICPKSFSTSDGLRSHTYTHTGEKPHQCSECGKTFTQRGNMVNHMRRVHKPEKMLQKQASRKKGRKSHKKDLQSN
ncbi:zinc finger protein 420 isoform X2 [Esox lucius]|nr:zinc finger protein 420 isoform X2 [Esox lucius]